MFYKSFYNVKILKKKKLKNLQWLVRDYYNKFVSQLKWLKRKREFPV